MTARHFLYALMLMAAFAAAVYPFQNRWARYEREMQDPVDDPPDALDKTEFAFGRLRYRSPRDGRFRARWGTDANKGERLFMQALRRLSRVNVRSIEEIVDVDSDEIYNWPFMYAVGVGDWVLSSSQAERLRNFFERGGFLMVDDFHNDGEWEDFMEGVRKIFPNPTVVEIASEDPQRLSLRARRLRSALARDSGRARPCGHRRLPQHGRRRRVGVGRLSPVPGANLVTRLPPGLELRRLHDDALT
jgi:hypothetical protein